MLEPIIALLAASTAEWSKKHGIDPRFVAALISFLVAFSWEIGKVAAEGTVEWSNFGAILTTGGTAWITATGIYELIIKPIKNRL